MQITNYRFKKSRNGNLNLIFNVNDKRTQCTASGYSEVPVGNPPFEIIDDQIGEFTTPGGHKLQTAIFDGFNSVDLIQQKANAIKEAGITMVSI